MNSPLPPVGVFVWGASVGGEGSLVAGGLVTSTSDVLAATDEAGSVELEPPQLAPTNERITTEMGTMIGRMRFFLSSSQQSYLLRHSLGMSAMNLEKIVNFMGGVAIGLRLTSTIQVT